VRLGTEPAYKVNVSQTRPFATLSGARAGELAEPVIQISGFGNEEMPLCLVMVVRHADIADTTSRGQAQLQAIRVTQILRDEVGNRCSQASDPASDLSEVFQTANATALESGAYFSCLVASIGPARLYAGGIGFSSVWLSTDGEMREVLGPNTLQHEDMEAAVLTAALGSGGFRKEQVRVCDLNLDKDDAALMVISRGRFSGIADKSCVSGRRSSATDLLDLVKPLTLDYCVAGAIGAV
jgi:hypothetical protein